MTEITKVVSTTLIAEGADQSQVAIAGRITSDKTLAGYLLSEAEKRKDKSIGALQWIIDFVKRLVELLLGLTNKEKTDKLNADARSCAEKFFSENKAALQNLSKPGELSEKTGNVLPQRAASSSNTSSPHSSWWRKMLGGSPGLQIDSASGAGGPRNAGSVQRREQKSLYPTRDKSSEVTPGRANENSKYPGDDESMDRTTRGELIEHGEDYYQHKAPEGDKAKSVKKNYFVKIRLDNGETVTRWGKELQHLILKENPLLGDQIRLTLLGKERVETDVRQPKEGSPGKFEWVKKEVDRNKWVLDFISEETTPKAPRRAP